MRIAVVDAAKRHGELVTDLAPEGARLPKPDGWASEGRRPQMRQGCERTKSRCALSRLPPGFMSARAFWSSSTGANFGASIMMVLGGSPVFKLRPFGAMADRTYPVDRR
jgi:hypothetical protein